MIAAYTVPLFVASLLVFFAGVAGRLYLGVAAVSGVLFLVLSARGLRGSGLGLRWAKGVFGFSLLYLVLIMGALVIDRIGT
jgi:protoheme IX farnesyltransferase